jgi:hypothetical protein
MRSGDRLADRFVAYSPALAAADVLSVDGVAPVGPNLSHWPGHRTPHALADLRTSTEMVLEAAHGPLAAGLRREVVTNTHLDTDGLLAVAAALRPELWPARRLLCDVATTGDFDRPTTRDALVRDRCIAGWAEHPASPLAAELARLDRPGRLALGFEYGLAHLDAALLDPSPWSALYREDVERFDADLARLGALDLRVLPEARLLVVRAAERIHRVVLRSCQPDRISHLLEQAGEGAWVFTEVIDSWFAPTRGLHPPRLPLERLWEALAALGRAQQTRCDGPDALWPSLAFTTDAAPDAVVQATTDFIRHTRNEAT